MRKAFYYILIFKIFLISIFSLNLSFGIESINGKVVVCKDSVYSFDYIELTEYGFKDTSKISMLIDSILFYDKHPYMLLLSNKDDKLTNSVLIKSCPITCNMQNSINGVYCSSIGKPLLIVGVPDETLNSYGLERTSQLLRINKLKLSPPKYVSYSLGYKLYLGIKNDSLADTKIAFNGGNLFDDPQIARKFSWYSGDIDSILLKSKYRHQRYHSYDRALYIAKSKGRGIDSYLSANRDTIYSTINYFVKQTFSDSIYNLRVYKFADSCDGRFLKRLCDSINGNNIFNQLSIKPLKIDPSQQELLISFDLLSNIDKNNINGVVLPDCSDGLIYLQRFTDDLLRDFGIEATTGTIPVRFISDDIRLGIDAIGYTVWVLRDTNGRFQVNMKYQGKYLDSKRSNPFEWLQVSSIHSLSLE